MSAYGMSEYERRRVEGRECEREHQLQLVSIVKRKLQIADGQLAVLREFAAADGYNDVWDWAAKFVGESSWSIGDWIEEFALSDWDAIEIAQRIMTYASPDGSTPWGEDFAGAETWTKEQFDKDVEAYLLPSSHSRADDEISITPEDLVLLRQMADAALAHQGAKARELSRKVATRWGFEGVQGA